MRLPIARTLLPALTLLALASAQGCSASPPPEDEGEIISDLDFYAASAREYFVSGTSTVTLDPALATADANTKLKRAKELVTLKNVAISWFLNTYLTDKEHEDANANYGGFGALTKFASEDPATITTADGMTYTFTYRVEVAGKKRLIDALPGTQLNGDGKAFTLQMGKITNADLARLEINHEWYRDKAWGDFDPSKSKPEELEAIDLTIVPQKGSSDAYLAYDRLFADGELTIGVHFGYDYHARYDIQGSRSLYDWLTKRQGFKSPVDSYDKYERTSEPLTKTITSNGKPILVKLSIFHPGQAEKNVPGPDPDTDDGGKLLEKDVRESLAKREVILWLGHSGPLYGFALANWKKTDEGDFDDSKIPTAEMPLGTYQIVMANGCNTYDMGQAFWNNPAKADHANINVITTTNFSNAATEASAVRVIAALTNQTRGKVVPSLVSELAAGLDRDQGFSFNAMFGVHGIDKNPKNDPLSDQAKLCAACATDADCGADGNRCTQVARGVRACTTGCVDDSGCPAAYACKGVRGATSRVTTKQCVPRSNSCR